MTRRTCPYGKKDVSLWQEGRVDFTKSTGGFFDFLQAIGRQGYKKLLLSGEISKTFLVPLKARAFSGSTLIEWGLKMPEKHKAWKALL